MNSIQLLQHLLQRFPRLGSASLDLSPVERSLRKYLGVEKAFFLLRHPDGLRSPSNKALLIPAKDALFRRLLKDPRPMTVPSRSKGQWASFWPVVMGKRWQGGFALGKKKDGKSLGPDETGMMEILSSRAGLLLEASELLENLQTAERQASLGFLTSAMTHEIRNPLTAMGTLVQLLPHKKEDKAFMDSFQKLMLKEIQHLNRLTENFLDFSKGESQEAGQNDLQPVIERVCWLMGPLFASKRIQFKWSSPSPLWMKVPESQMESLLMNLLQNAFQSTPALGTVTLSARFLAGRSGPGRRVEIQVRDNGKGIPQENLARISRPYFSTRAEGFGLGLAVCQRVIENLGGRWTVQSRKNPSRTTVKVVLRDGLGPKE